MENFMRQHSELISIVKDLLGLISPLEREQLKNWILSDQKIAISGFILQKTLVCF